MTKWTAPDIASIRGDNSRPLQKIFGSLTEYLKDTLSQTTEVSQTYVRNGEATALTIGTVVYLDAQQGDRATVKRAFNTSDATSAKTLGVVAENIPANSDGLVTTLGYLEKVNTSAFTAGQTLYLGSTAGTFTATKPVAPNHMVYVGVVVRANAGNGIIYVRCQNGYELDEIHDVLITSPTAGQTLSYDAVNSLWKNATFSDGGGLTNLNASNLASGTVPTGRMTGSYTGITGIGTLTVGSIPATLLTGTVASARISGSYTGITQLGTISPSLTVTGGSGTTITGTTQTLINGTNNNSGIYLGAGTAATATGGIEASWRDASNPSIAIGVTRDNNGTKTIWEYSNKIDSFTSNTLRTRVNSDGFIIAGTGSLYLSGSTNSALTFANTPDTAMPWMQGPVLQGQTGWAFYSAGLGSYRMGFRGSSSGAARYMWCVDAALIGSNPDDAAISRTLNVIGSGRFTGILNPNGGISGNVLYGSFGSLSVYGENGGWYGIAFPDSASHWMSTQNGQYFGVYRNNSTWNFYVVNGTFVPSDERYKRDIEPLQHGMNLIREIITVTYDPLTEDPADDPEQTVGRTHYGFTTQNILQALANVGETRDVALVDIGGPASKTNESDRQYLNHSGLIAPMVKAIQELDARLQQLETV